MAEVQLPTRKDLETKYNITNDTQQSAHIEPVISGKVMRKKKTLGKRMVEMLIGSDTPDIGQYILEAAVIPMIRNMLCDIPQLIFFRRASPRSQWPPTYPGNQYTNYSKLSFSQENNVKTDMYGRPIPEKRNYMFDDIILSNLNDAEIIRSHMCDIISSYGYVSVAQVNEMMGIVPSVTDYDWGWRNIASSNIRHVREGFLLELPKAIYLK